MPEQEKPEKPVINVVANNVQIVTESGGGKQEDKGGDVKKSEGAEATRSPKGSSGAGLFLMGAVLFVIGAVSIKDGFISPPEDWEHWKIVFNQVVAVGGILGGLGVIIYGLLRPRGTGSSEGEEPREPKSDA